MHVEFAWPDDLVLGINQVDAEHIAIIAQIEMLQALEIEKDGVSDFEDIANGIKDISIKHFAHEERMMEKHCVPDFERHKREHSSFINQITRFISLSKKDNNDTALQFHKICGNWYIKHIRTYDKKMALYI